MCDLYVSQLLNERERAQFLAHYYMSKGCHCPARLEYDEFCPTHSGDLCFNCGNMDAAQFLV